MKSIIRLFILAILFSSCGDQSPDHVDSYLGFGINPADIDAFLQENMDNKNIPGLAVAIINKGEVVYHRKMGYADRENQIPVDDQTIFEAASLSKPVFGYFVMHFVEEGKLDLDKPLYEYLPYPDIADDERYKNITARMCLSHQTGFPNWRTDYPDKKLFIQFDPGTDYSYSGEGYQYLAKVLKEIEGTDWEGLEAKFQEVVARPLGLEHTVFIQDDYAEKHKAIPYDENGTAIVGALDGDSTLRYSFIAPASIHSEAIDFSKWLIALMNDKGLSKESYKTLFKDHSYVGDDPIPAHYTLGFFHPDIPLVPLYGHGGNNYGFTAWFMVDRSKDWGYVLFSNSEYGEELGGEMMFYLMAGPDNTPLYIWGGAIAVVALTLIGFLIYLIIRLIRRRSRRS